MRAFVRFGLSGSLFVALFMWCAFPPAPLAHADATSSNADIQSQIDQQNQNIQQLDQQIAGYQKQLDAVSAQKQTLQTAIKSIDLSKQKTTTQINATQDQISSANLTLGQLGDQITNKQAAIELDQQTLAASLREIASADQVSPLVALLSSDTLTDAWSEISAQIQLNEALQANVSDLNSDKVQLSSQQTQVGNTKDQLVQLSTNLQTQQGQLTATENAKQQLLTSTKNTESSYEQIIAEKKAQEQVFENELTQLQTQLKNVSSSEIPASGSGILSWPFSSDVMDTCPGKASVLGNPDCITQYFGNTPFATANPSIYDGMGHDGLDIGVPIGTPVQAALTGTVIGTGDTDLTHDAEGDQCYSFGKWIMLQHANGLNTMYAHLSEIDVTVGQTVSTGDVIGYSGMTGYATGPHLHFGVYASAGVKIMTLNEFRGATTPCANATMPVAPANAYLNPLSYLPV